MVDHCGALLPFRSADRRTFRKGIRAFRAVGRRIYADRHKDGWGVGSQRAGWRMGGVLPLAAR
jgi:hypothetical protein